MVEQTQQLTEEQILDGLFEATKNLPTKPVTLERLGMDITLKGLLAKKVDSIREKCTGRVKEGGVTREKIDRERFNAALIVDATVDLKVKGLQLNGWGDTRLTARMQLSSGEEVVRRLLLAGELDALSDEVMELSGFGVNLTEVKNE
ncbi:hypothetical protein GJ688_02045 [Heliobacillus mobilis]|uniref:XkdN-like protein n=1 Tax=Heliobacterium mobile TaxID=28064 RepID=A0A6I3SG49_HELMO|nr:hypothetical protein [Heliobacterium mobile]MTV47764.1 hypothetical protein [Heliobacterium mobile]